MAELIWSIVGSQLVSNVVLIVLTLTPAFIAHCLYAGHAGSITINSSPGLSRLEIARNTPNLAPGITRTFSELIPPLKCSLQNSEIDFLNSPRPFAGPYLPNPFSYTSDSEFLTDCGGLKSGSPTSR